MAYGGDMSSKPRLTPSSLNWTPTTPTLSEGLAETGTLFPETVADGAGDEIETVGYDVSDPALTVTVVLAVTDPWALVAVRV
jgi:hypothetical protein